MNSIWTVPPREAIRLLYVSKSRFGGDWNSVPHTHSCTEVFYCVDGRGQFNVEGKMLDVAPGRHGHCEPPAPCTPS